VDPEDAAPLVTDAAYSTALQVRHTTGVEGHLPAPGATVVRAGRGQPWQVVSVTADTLRLRDLAGDVVEVSRRSVRPDPLDTQIGLLANHWRLTRARVDNQPGSQPLPTLSRKRPYVRQVRPGRTAGSVLPPNAPTVLMGVRMKSAPIACAKGGC